jgi:hypothetical protein
MYRARLLRVCLVLSLIAVCVLAGCSDTWRGPRLRLPRRGPVDVFLGIIDQVKQIGDGIARQFRGMSGGRR